MDSNSPGLDKVLQLLVGGRNEEAVRSASAALAAAPRDPGLFNALAIALRRLGKVEESLASFRRAAELAPDSHEIRNNYGLALVGARRPLEAVPHLRAALQRDPSLLQTQVHLQIALRQIVPRGAATVFASRERLESLDAELRHIVREGMTVLSIGGAGIAALMALRAGAGVVIAAQLAPIAAACLGDAAVANGGAARLRIIAKALRALELGSDLPAPADVIVIENLDPTVVGDGVLTMLGEMLPRIAAPGAVVLPRRIELWAQILEAPRLWQRRHPARVAGLDLGAFGAMSSRLLVANEIEDATARPLSMPLRMMDLDLASLPLRAQERHAAVTIEHDGEAHAVSLIKHAVYDGAMSESERTMPDFAQDPDHMIILLRAARRLAAGAALGLRARHDGSVLWVDDPD